MSDKRHKQVLQDRDVPVFSLAPDAPAMANSEPLPVEDIADQVSGDEMMQCADNKPIPHTPSQVASRTHAPCCRVRPAVLLRLVCSRSAQLTQASAGALTGKSRPKRLQTRLRVGPWEQSAPRRRALCAHAARAVHSPGSVCSCASPACDQCVCCPSSSPASSPGAGKEADASSTDELQRTAPSMPPCPLPAACRRLSFAAALPQASLTTAVVCEQRQLQHT